MRAILPSWTDPDPTPARASGRADRPRAPGAGRAGADRAALRQADRRRGHGHRPLPACCSPAAPDAPTASRPRPSCCDVARERADRGAPAQHPHRRGRWRPPAAARRGGRHRAVRARSSPDDRWLPAIDEAMRVLRPGGRLVVIGYYGRDDMAGPAGAGGGGARARGDPRRTGWWLRHGFKIKVVHSRVDLRRRGRRPMSCCRSCTASAAAPSWPRHTRSACGLRLGLYHLRPSLTGIRHPPRSVRSCTEICGFSAGIALQPRNGASMIGRSKARLFSPRSLAFGMSAWPVR